MHVYRVYVMVMLRLHRSVNASNCCRGGGGGSGNGSGEVAELFSSFAVKRTSKILMVSQ